MARVNKSLRLTWKSRLALFKAQQLVQLRLLPGLLQPHLAELTKIDGGRAAH